LQRGSILVCSGSQNNMSPSMAGWHFAHCNSKLQKQVPLSPSRQGEAVFPLQSSLGSYKWHLLCILPITNKSLRFAQIQG
jgi:hypothetical protein